MQQRRNSPSPTVKRTKPMRPKQMRKRVERLSTPIDRPMVEVEVVRPNDKEHHEHFAAVLRDPSPISPERARELKSVHSGSFSARSARVNNSGSYGGTVAGDKSCIISEYLDGSQTPRSPFRQGSIKSTNSMLNSRYLQTWMEQDAKQREECNFKPDLSLT